MSADSAPIDAGRSLPRRSDELSILDVITMLRAHAVFIVVCALAGAVLAGIYVVSRPPVYEAVTLLRIDPSRAGSLGVSEPGVADAVNETAVIQTEIGIIASDGVAIRALKALTEQQFEALCGYSRPSSGFAKGNIALSERDEQTLRAQRAAISVTLVDGTKLVRISAKDHNAAVAAAFANALVTAYRQHSADSRAASVAQLNTWLTAQMASLAQQGASAQDRLADFQRTHDIIGTEGTSNTVSDRLRMLNERLTAAEADRIAKEGQAMALGTADADILASVFTNPRLAELQRQQGVAAAEHARLAAKFGDGYPPLEQSKQQMSAIEHEVAANVESTRRRLRQEVEATRHVETDLRDRYRQQREMAYAIARNQEAYQALQAEVITSRELYNSLRVKLQQASVEAEVSGVNVTLVDTARAPIAPVGLPKAVLVTAGVLVGAFAGVAGSLLAEATSKQRINVVHHHVPTLPSVGERSVTA